MAKFEGVLVGGRGDKQSRHNITGGERSVYSNVIVSIQVETRAVSLFVGEATLVSKHPIRP